MRCKACNNILGAYSMNKRQSNGDFEDLCQDCLAHAQVAYNELIDDGDDWDTIRDKVSKDLDDY